MEIIGYIGAVLMGTSLGLIGGGGSILTVPILVYLFGIPAELSTAYSLFIVGLTSLFGSFTHMKMGNIHWKTALVFGIPSIVSVYLTRHFVVPAIPDILLTSPFKLDKDMANKLFAKDAANNDFGFTHEEIIKIVKDLEYTKDDYLALAKNYETIFRI
jgi:hypothetical protein